MTPKILLLAAALALSACAPTDEPSPHAVRWSGFTTENIMEVHTGMKSDKIQEMFGAPKNVSQAVCEDAYGTPLNCTTWEYGDFPDWASFRFSGDSGSLVLSDFKVHRR
jgi:hypothetical protein